MRMIYMLFVVFCLTLSILCQARAGSSDRVPAALTAWQEMAQQPLKMDISLKNAMADCIIYAGQPLLINIGLRNEFAQELIGLSDEQKTELEKARIEPSASDIELCPEGVQWTELIKIRMGVDQDHPIWESKLRSTSRPRMIINRVDANPVSTMNYLVLDTNLSPGEYLVWAEFNRLRKRNDSSMIGEGLAVCSAPISVDLRVATNAAERAWVFAEKGAMLKRAHKYIPAEMWYKKAINEAPAMGRGPKIQGVRHFNLSWELVDIYEATSRYEDALRAARHTREYIEERASGLRQMFLKQVDTRIEHIEKKVRQKGATPPDITTIDSRR